MSQGYKLRFDQMKESDPTELKQSPTHDEPSTYPSDSSSRELCLVFKDGTMDFIPYSYIVYKKFRMSNEKNSITIELPTKVITLSGYGLLELVQSISRQIPRTIYQIDERYASPGDSAVTEIVVEESNKG